MQTYTRVLVVGGDGRRLGPGRAEGARTIPSPRYGGNGAQQQTVSIVRSRTVDVVVLLVRWMGHSEYKAIVDACRTAGVRVLLVAGGLGAAARQLEALRAGPGGASAGDRQVRRCA